jgi:hypothetical protein
MDSRDFCRKYQILDDCARLREIIETFPDDRHFIPSVLFILWNEDELETLPDDLRRMVRCTLQTGCESRAALTRDRSMITRRRASQNPTRHLLCHRRQRTWMRYLGRCWVRLSWILLVDSWKSCPGKVIYTTVEVISWPIHNVFRVFAIGHRTLEGFCLGLGGEVLHRH